MRGPGRRAAILLWGGLLLCALGLATAVIAVVSYSHTAGKPGIPLAQEPVHVALPAGQTYGIYVNDADNSGYSESCTITEASGEPVDQHDPGWTMSSSETEVLDIEFNTGAGRLTIDCSVPGERLTLRAVPDLHALVTRVLLGGVLTCAGGALLLIRIRSRRRPAPPTWGTFGPPQGLPSGGSSLLEPPT